MIYFLLKLEVGQRRSHYEHYKPFESQRSDVHFELRRAFTGASKYTGVAVAVAGPATPSQIRSEAVGTWLYRLCDPVGIVWSC